MEKEIYTQETTSNFNTVIDRFNDLIQSIQFELDRADSISISEISGQVHAEFVEPQLSTRHNFSDVILDSVASLDDETFISTYWKTALNFYGNILRERKATANAVVQKNPLEDEVKHLEDKNKVLRDVNNRYRQENEILRTIAKLGDLSKQPLDRSRVGRIMATMQARQRTQGSTSDAILNINNKGEQIITPMPRVSKESVEAIKAIKNKRTKKPTVQQMIAAAYNQSVEFFKDRQDKIEMPWHFVESFDDNFIIQHQQEIIAHAAKHMNQRDFHNFSNLIMNGSRYRNLSTSTAISTKKDNLPIQ